MGWSTREIAQMAGTTIAAVRYYHRIGLLDEPERRSNGYKQYGAGHLARVLQIRRLSELGIPLDELGRGGDHGEVTERLRRLDAEFAAGMERLRRARADIAVMLSGPDPLETPPGFESIDGQLTDPDRALMWIYRSTLDDASLEDVRSMIAVEPDDISREYAELDAGATEKQRQHLAERMAVLIADHVATYPWMRRSPSDPEARVLMRAVADLYNDAQLDVLRRAITLADEHRRDDEAAR